MAVDLLDGLDASLQDFEPPVSPTSMRHSSALPSEPATEDLEESDIGSGGGYSPPAWRNLGNGDRSRGFWKPQPERFHRALSPDSDDDYQSDDDVVLEQAIRTRLPQGSLSPDKGRSPSPPPPEDTTLKVDHKSPSRELPLADLRASPQPPDNCNSPALAWVSPSANWVVSPQTSASLCAPRFCSARGLLKTP